MAVVVRLLGEVSSEVDGQPVDLGTPKQRCVLAALAVDAGRVVPMDRLVERVSGAAHRSRATVQSYIAAPSGAGRRGWRQHRCRTTDSAANAVP